MSHVIGSVEVGKLADLVLYDPKYFGTKPEVVLKGGLNTICMMGDANASIPTPQPVISRKMFGAHHSVLSQNCLTFVSQASLNQIPSYNLQKRIVAVKACRKISKADMKLNNFCPSISVDPETYKVTVDGQEISAKPAKELPMTQAVFLF